MRLNQKGSTLVELIMVMMLIILFSLTLSSLIFSGSETQKRIIEEKNTQIDARIALSYLNMRLRQSDAADKVSVEKNALTGEDSLLIKERGEGFQYDMWIFWTGGNLVECLVDPGEQPSELMSEKIASIEGFKVHKSEEGSITNTISYVSNEKPNEMSSVIYLRSR